MTQTLTTDTSRFEFGNQRFLRDLLGQHDAHLRGIENALSVTITAAGSHDHDCRRPATTRVGRPRPHPTVRPHPARLSRVSQRRGLRGPHPQPRPRREPAGHLSRYSLRLVQAAHDHTQERCAEDVHRRYARVRHRVRHRTRGHGQDVFGNGRSRGGADESAGTPRGADPPRGGGRGEARLPARGIWPRRSTRICGRCTTRCTTWWTSTEARR